MGLNCPCEAVVRRWWDCWLHPGWINCCVCDAAGQCQPSQAAGCYYFCGRALCVSQSCCCRHLCAAAADVLCLPRTRPQHVSEQQPAQRTHHLGWLLPWEVACLAGSTICTAKPLIMISQSRWRWM